MKIINFRSFTENVKLFYSRKRFGVKDGFFELREFYVLMISKELWGK